MTGNSENSPHSPAHAEDAAGRTVGDRAGSQPGVAGGARPPRRGLLPLALVLLVMLAAVAVFAHANRQVRVQFTVQADAPARIQVFHDERGNFDEWSSNLIDVGPQASAITIEVHGAQARHLRFDPPPGVGLRVCGPHIDGAPGSDHESTRMQEVSLRPDGEDCVRLQAPAGARDPQWSVAFTGPAALLLDSARTSQRVFIVALAAALALLAWCVYAARAFLPRELPAVRALARIGVIEASLHWWLAALMLIAGGAYAFITPPGAVPDEEAHLAKIVRIANGVPFGDSGDLPLPKIRLMYGPFKDYQVNKKAFTPAQLATQRAAPMECRVVAGNALAKGANGYFPHHYALATIAYMAGCAGGASAGTFLYAARLLNLLLAVALVAWGVSQARYGKWGLALVALLPMSMFQMASLSADSLILGLSVAWIGLVSGIAGGGVSAARAQGPLWVLALTIALLKPGAAWILAALVFCKPAFDQAGRSFTGALLKFVALPWVIHVAWILFASGEAPGHVGVDPKANMALLTTNPLAVLGKVVSAFIGIEGYSLWIRLIGILGWLDVPLARWSYKLGTVAVVAAFWANAVNLPRRPHSYAPLAWTFALGSAAVLALPLFLFWTPAEAAAVKGLQGRYFLPTIAFLMAFSGFRSPNLVRVPLIALIVVAAVVLNVDALERLHTAYWVAGR